MSRTVPGPPQISLSNWILGGSIISHSTTSLTSTSSKNRKASSTSKYPAKPSEKETSTQVPTLPEPEKKPEDGAKSPAESEKKDTKTDSTNGWTTAQDTQLLELKTANKSWAEIAVVLGSSKSNVRERFKTLQSATTAASIKSDGMTQTSPDKEKDPGKDETSPNSAPVMQEKKGKLAPDAVWTKEDCEILEMLEERYREQKWLQIQAAFYNVTGRMVVAELIERKFCAEGS